MTERRPRTTGELLSDGMAVLRRHFKTLVPLALPFCALDLLLREGGQAALASVRTAIGSNPANLGMERVFESLAAGAGGIGLFLGSVVATQLLLVAVVAASSEAWYGRPPTIAHSLATIVARGAAHIVTFLLFMGALLAAFVVPLVVGVVGGMLIGEGAGAVVMVASVAVAIAAVVLVTLRLGLYAQAVVLEGRSALQAFARSTELMAARGQPFLESPKFRLSLMFLVTFGLSASLQALFALPRMLVAAAGGWSVADGLPPLMSMPLAFIVPAALIEAAVNSLLLPLTGILPTLFYFDVRVRAEALDIEGAT